MTNKHKHYTSKFEEITNKYGLDLDGDWNKQLMLHRGRHANKYHDYMFESIKDIDDLAQGNVKVFLQEFDKIKQTVVKTPEMLYKMYWINL